MKKIKISLSLLLALFSLTLTATNYYWIGGTGNWTDGSHWSTSSGGPQAGLVPTAADNVFFDGNSFMAASQTVTINAAANCNNMDWTGANNTPTLSGISDLNVYGSLTLISSMNNLWTGKLYFKSTASGNTITSAGLSFNNEVHFDGANADWTMQDAFSVSGTAGAIFLDNGYLATNNNSLTCYYFESNGSNSRGLYLGTSTVTVNGYNSNSRAWNVSGTNFSIDAGTSLIKLTVVGTVYFEGGNGNYYFDILFVDATTSTGVILSGTGFNNVTYNANAYINTVSSSYNVLTVAKNAQFNGNANYCTKGVFLQTANFGQIGETFDTLQLTPGYSYTLTPPCTLTVNNNASMNGTCSSPINILTSSIGSSANISSATTITGNYLQLRDIHAIGGGTFIANNSTDLGNNNGWTINAPTPRTVYWRGGSGNWNDQNHWSLTSGGTGGACVPTPIDNVIFNSASFTAGSKVVTLNVNAYCKDMNWTGATNTPILTGSQQLYVYGSLTLISAMNITGLTGQILFRAPNSGNTLTSAGRVFAGDLVFEGGGNWTLLDALNTGPKNIYLSYGTLNTNSKTVSCNDFMSNYNNARGLILGSSTINVAGTTWTTNPATLFSLNAGTSTIKLTSSSAGINFDGGDNLLYYNLITQDPASDITFNSGKNFHNATFYGHCYLYGGGNYNKLDFRNGLWLGNTTNVDSILFSPGTLNKFMNNVVVNVGKYFMADGTAGNLTKIYNYAGTQIYYLNKASCNVCCNYLDIQYAQAGGGANWYADNSTNGPSNTGWNFASCPSASLTVGPITGNANPCMNSTGNTYSIPSLGGNATYTWTVPAGSTITSGQGTTSIQVTAASAGTISVTANACGTSGSATKAITARPVPSISSINVTSATCSHKDGSATVTVTGGSTPYKYQWSSGDTLSVADSLYSGQYLLNVSDLYGCTTNTIVTVVSSNGPSVSIMNTKNVDCNGGSTGSLTVSATGGTSPYTYAWTTGATTPVVNNLIAGTYVVTITDNTGCQVVGSYVVTQPSAMNIQYTVTPAGCSSSIGAITTNVTGGTGSYTYQWSANTGSQTSANVSSLAAGLYSVVVTDANSCSKTASIIVNTNTNGAGISLDNITAGTCGTNGPGAISISTFGGATPYTFNWSNGASTEDLSMVSPGTYSLGVVDANGCMTYTSFVVPNANPNYQPQICLVTFDTTTMSNLVAWEKTGAVGIQTYNIYCEIGSFNNYQLVGSVPAGNLSEFIHTGANPDVKSWKYKISAVDSCGNETPLSPYHKTIHLQISNGSGGAQNLSWDNYDGFSYGGFEVWRHTPTTNWVQLTSIAFCGYPVCTNTYTDFTPVPGDTNRYAILVNAPATCVTTARLNNNGTQGAIVKTRSNVKNNRANNPTTGIVDGVITNKYAVYPNPATSEITVSLNKDCSNCVFEIMNALGQTIKSEKLTSYETKMNIASLPNGVYYVKVKSDKYAQYTQKLVIQH